MSNKPPKPDGTGPGPNTRSRNVMDALPTEAEGDALFDELFGALEEDAAAEPAAPDEDLETVRPPAGVEGPPVEIPSARGPAPAADDDDDLMFDDELVEGADELSDTNQLPAAQPPARPEPPYAQPYDLPPVRATAPVHHERTAEPPGLASDGDLSLGEAAGLEADDGVGIDFADAVRPQSEAPPSATDALAAEERSHHETAPHLIRSEGIAPVAPPRPPPPRMPPRMPPSIPQAETPIAGGVQFDDEADEELATVAIDGTELFRLARQAATTRDDDEIDTGEVAVAPLPAPLPEQGAAPAADDGGEAELDADELAAIEAAEAEVGDDAELVDDIDDADVEGLEAAEPVALEMDGAEAVAFDASGAASDAVVALMQQGERDAWVSRADWLYDEAPRLDPPHASNAAARANALLTISEMLAMAGEDERAETVAREALQLAPSHPLAHRQLRGLLMARGRWTEVADALDAEGRVAPSAEAKLHAAYLGAEVARLSLGDPDAANRRLDQAERVTRFDTRVQIARLAQSLASADEIDVEGGAFEGVAFAGDSVEGSIVEGSTAEGDAAGVLNAALRVLATIRSDGSSGGAASGGAAGADSPYATMLSARAALRKRDLGAVVTALAALEQREEFAPGAAWLTGTIAGARADLRPVAIAALGRVSAGSHGAVAQRARVARAMEAGDSASALAVADEAAADVLSAGERLIIASLANKPLEELVSWLTRAQHDDEMVSLAAAAASRLADPDQINEYNVGEGAYPAAVTLGRQLAALAGGAAPAGALVSPGDDDDEPSASDPPASHPPASPVEAPDSVEVELEDAGMDGAVVAPPKPPPRRRAAGQPDAARTGLGEAVRDAAIQLIESDPDSGAARAVLLEHGYTIGETDKVAATLAGPGAVGLVRERALTAALIAELAQDRERMAAELERAAAAAPEDVAALRMAMVLGDAIGAAQSLIRFAEASDDPTKSAIAFTEAGLRLMEEPGMEADGEALLRRAAETQPALPIAAFIGMYIAGAFGDADGERWWLEQRRAVALEPTDGVSDTIRLALQMGDGEAAERATLLGDAHRAMPNDFTLRDMYEQAAGVVDDRAAWLVERAAEPGADGSAAALEAALAFELDGDLDQAAASVKKALEAGDKTLAPIFAERYALDGLGSGRVIETLEGQLRTATEASERAEIARAIALIEARGRGDRSKATAALQSVLGQASTDLLLLMALEQSLMDEGSVDGLHQVALSIARAVPGPDGVAHAMLAARLLSALGPDKAYEAVELAFGAEQPTSWSLRQMSMYSRLRGDPLSAASIDRALADQSPNAVDQSTLMLRAAEAAIAGGEEEVAAGLLASVLDAMPRHQVALLLRASQLERLADPGDAAQAYEELAMAIQAPRERAAKLYKAASIWLSLEDGSGQDEGRRLLEAVTQIDARYEDTFELLQSIYLGAGAKRELADLLAARLENVSDPAERVELEVLRGKMLVQAGSAGEAREALSAALEASPDNADALSAYADVCAAEGDYEAVEQSIIRLGRLVSEPDKQVQIYLRLGKLYSKHLPNPERAEMAYQEVLKRAPDNSVAREALVALFLDAGETQKAFEQQEALIAAAKSQGDKCSRTVRMAEIHEAAGDPKEAEAVLVKARRTWNKEPAPVVALYRFYKRNGQEPAADMLLDRAAAEVRRGLGAGRFEAPLFAMARMVAEMRDQADAAHVAQATLAAIEGEPTYIEGAGILAAQPELDEHIAPEIFTEAFRALLSATGHLMDEAAPFDLGSLRAKPLPPPHTDVLERTRELAAGYGIPEISVQATNALGLACVPARCQPPTLCFGLPLVSSDRADVREFLVHRALKVLQTRTAALSRTAPIDLWPLVAAYLRLHSPSFNPSGVDPTKVNDFFQRMAPMAPRANPQISLLASEVIASIGNRASSLNTAANAWGSRAGLLAMGDPNLALEAIAWSVGNSQGAPPAGAERVRWIGRQAEARDLIVFSVSEGYAIARAHLGLDAAAVESIDVMPD